MDSAKAVAGVSLRNVILRSVLLFFVVSPVATGIMLAIILSVLRWYLSSQAPFDLWRANFLFQCIVISYFAGAIPAAVAGGIVAKFRGYWKARSAAHLFAMFVGSMSFVVFSIVVDLSWALAPNVFSAILDLALPALGALVCSVIAAMLGWYHRD